MGRYKVLFSLLIALAFTLGLLVLPEIESFTKSCAQTILCGANVSYILEYISKTDVAALAFGNYLYQTLISGLVVFLLTLILSVIAHRMYTRFK